MLWKPSKSLFCLTSPSFRFQIYPSSFRFGIMTETSRGKKTRKRNEEVEIFERELIRVTAMKKPYEAVHGQMANVWTEIAEELGGLGKKRDGKACSDKMGVLMKNRIAKKNRDPGSGSGALPEATFEETLLDDIILSRDGVKQLSQAEKRKLELDNQKEQELMKDAMRPFSQKQGRKEKAARFQLESTEEDRETSVERAERAQESASMNETPQPEALHTPRKSPRIRKTVDRSFGDTPEKVVRSPKSTFRRKLPSSALKNQKKEENGSWFLKKLEVDEKIQKEKLADKAKDREIQLKKFDLEREKLAAETDQRNQDRIYQREKDERDAKYREDRDAEIRQQLANSHALMLSLISSRTKNSDTSGG